MTSNPDALADLVAALDPLYEWLDETRGHGAGVGRIINRIREAATALEAVPSYPPTEQNDGTANASDGMVLAVEGVEPVAWQVKDYADGWITYGHKVDAENTAELSGALIRPLYALPLPVETRSREGERERIIDIIYRHMRSPGDGPEFAYECADAILARPVGDSKLREPGPGVEEEP